MKRGIYILAIVFWATSCKKDAPLAPPLNEFVKNYGTADDEIARCVKVIGDTDIVIAGYSSDATTGHQTPFLLRTNKNGEQRWFRNFGSFSSDVCWSFDVTEDGGFIVASQSSFATGNADFLIQKSDGDGNILWSRNYGGAFDEFPTKVVALHNGSLIVGISNSGHDDNAWIIRLNDTGDSLWSYNWGGNGADGAMSVCENADGTFAVTGYTNSSAIGNTDGFLMVLNDSGQELHHYIFGTTEYDEPHAIVPSIDGDGWMICGHEGSSVDISTHDVFLAHIHEDGTQEWNKLYGGAAHDGAEDMVVTNETYNIIGRSRSHEGNEEDLFYLRVAQNGVYLKECWYGTTVDDAGYGISVMSGNLIVCGSTKGGAFGNKDIYLRRSNF